MPPKRYARRAYFAKINKHLNEEYKPVEEKSIEEKESLFNKKFGILDNIKNKQDNLSGKINSWFRENNVMISVSYRNYDKKYVFKAYNLHIRRGHYMVLNSSNEAKSVIEENYYIGQMKIWKVAISLL